MRAIDPPFLAWDEAGRYVTAGVIVAAAIYQVTPLKQACLVKCRSPMMFLAERWRHGRLGGLELGARHGAWCLGCCWALMAALFAVGVMSLGWMALIAAFIAAEKLLPWPVAARRTVAILLLLLGLGIAIAPADVPGFAEPGMSMPDSGGGRATDADDALSAHFSPVTRKRASGGSWSLCCSSSNSLFMWIGPKSGRGASSARDARMWSSTWPFPWKMYE